MKKKTQLETVTFENNVVNGTVSVRSVDTNDTMWFCKLEQDTADGARAVVHSITIPADNAVDATIKYRKIIPAGIGVINVYTTTEDVNVDEPTSVVDESDHGINSELEQ